MNARPRLALLIVAWALACAGLARLGLWQLDRAAEKETRYAGFVERRDQPPVDPDTYPQDIDADRLRWRRAIVRGRYSDRHLLLDNRVKRGRAGYELLTALETSGGNRILVNRGWVPMGEDRASLPQVAASTTAVDLAGYLGPAPASGISLGTVGEVEWMSPNVARVQMIAVDASGRITGAELKQTVWPLMIYLDPGAAGARDASWQLPGSGAERHRAYAVQWFSMATILAAIGLWQWRRSKRR